MLQNPGDPPETVLQTGMAKPPTSVRSIRLSDGLWAQVAAAASIKGVTVNAAVAEAVTSWLFLNEGAAPVAPDLAEAREFDVVLGRLDETHGKAPRRRVEPAVLQRFLGTTALGEPLPERRAYQKGQKK